MAEGGKYGRLFTELDLKLVAAEAAVQLLERLNRVGLSAYGTRPSKEDLHEVIEAAIAHEDADNALTFPPDEPLFLLRAQDEAADAYPLAVYFHQSADVGAGDEHLKGVAVAMREFTAWKLDHPDRVKVPD